MADLTEEQFDALRYIARAEKGTPRGERAAAILAEAGQPLVKAPLGADGVSAASGMGKYAATMARRAVDALGLGFPERIGDRIRAIGTPTIEDVRAERYADEDEFRSKHPWSTLAADVGGGLAGAALGFAVPGGQAAGAGAMARALSAINAAAGTNRWGRAAKLGAAGGAVSGWNVSREDDDYGARAKEAAFDAGLGAVLGPAFEAAAPAVVRGAQWAGNAFNPKGRVEARAQRRVGASLEDSADDHGVDAAERAAQIKAGLADKQAPSLGSQPYRMVDAGGEQFEYQAGNVLMHHAGSGKFRRFLIGRQRGNPETGMLSHQQRMARAVDDAFDVPQDPETGRPLTAKQLKNREEDRLKAEYRKAYADADAALVERGLDRMEINVNRAVEALETIVGRGLLHGGGQLGAKNLDRMITGLLKKLRSAKPMALDPDEAVLLMDLGDGLFAAPPREAVHEFKAAMDVVRAKLKEANKLEAQLLAARKRTAKAGATKEGRVSKAQAKVDAAQKAVDEIGGSSGLSDERIAELRSAIEADEAWVANARSEMEARAAEPDEAVPEPGAPADSAGSAQETAARQVADEAGPRVDDPGSEPLYTFEPDEAAVEAAKKREAELNRAFQENSFKRGGQSGMVGRIRRRTTGRAQQWRRWTSRAAPAEARRGAISVRHDRGRDHASSGAKALFNRGAQGRAGDGKELGRLSHIEKGTGSQSRKVRFEYTRGYRQMKLLQRFRDEFPERPPEWHAEQARLAQAEEFAAPGPARRVRGA